MEEGLESHFNDLEQKVIEDKKQEQDEKFKN